MVSELADALEAESVDLRLAAVRERVRQLLRRSGLAERVRIDPTLDAAAAGDAAGREFRWRTR
jgi:anti-anti-sigma regulatory factor